MTTSKRLAAFRAAQPKDEQTDADQTPDPTRPIEDEEDETTTSIQKDKENQDMKEEIDKAKAEGLSEGKQAANDRMNAVFASEHYEGREAAAAKLLGKNMTAEDIIDVLADMPKIERTALTEDQQREAADEAGRKEMKAAIEETENSGIDAGSAGVKPDARAEADARWAKARPLADKGVK